MDYPLPQTLQSSSTPSVAISTEIAAFDLNALTREAAAMARPRWSADGGPESVRISMRLQDPAVIHGRARHLRAGLIDLFAHCVGPVWDREELFIETRMESAYLCLIVSGECRSSSDSESVFQTMFATGDADTLENKHPVIREIVHQHAGTATLETDSKERLSITMRFPVSPHERRLKIETDEPNASRKPRVLMVDDDGTVLDINSQILRREGYEVVCSRDSTEALEYLACGTFDLLITDDIMPGFCGPHLAAAARAFIPERPVILVTGYASRFIPGEATPEHVDRVLTKPITPQELRQTVTDTLTAGFSAS